MKKTIQIMIRFLVGMIGVAVSFLAVMLYDASRWVIATWGLLSIDEIIYHLKAPLEGTNTDVLRDFAETCTPKAILAALFVIVILVALRKSKGRYYLTIAALLAASAVGMYQGGRYVWQELEVGSYVEAQKEVSVTDEEYVDPRTVRIEFPEKKRNLIYIFLESMENTYMSKEEGGAFERNCIPELTELADSNISFYDETENKGMYAAVGSTWTMGGMFAQTSGLPLKLPFDENAMGTQREFFPEICTMGDILNRAGYKQELLVGSYAVFGGRSLYFTQHGNFEIFDYPRAKELKLIPQDYNVWWGYEDEKLFQYAKDEAVKLSETGEPFNLTLLTADTHFEDGYYCRLCNDEYGEQYADVMACSSRQVTEFVQWVQQQPFYENTTIVVVGDHLTMDKDFCSDVEKDYQRTVYNAFINSAVTTDTSSRTATTMDMFPTTLASMGIVIEGDKLGLGTNLFSDAQTLAEKLGIKSLNNELGKKSELFDKLAKSIAQCEVIQDEENRENLRVSLNCRKLPEGAESVEFEIYGRDGGQEEQKLYTAEPAQTDVWEAQVSLSDFSYKQNLVVCTYVILKDGTREAIAEIEYSPK